MNRFIIAAAAAAGLFLAAGATLAPAQAAPLPAAAFFARRFAAARLTPSERRLQAAFRSNPAFFGGREGLALAAARLAARLATVRPSLSRAATLSWRFVQTQQGDLP